MNSKITVRVAVILALVIFGSYPAAYVFLSESSTVAGGRTLRVFPNELIAKMFYPASVVEQRITGKKVLLGSHG